MWDETIDHAIDEVAREMTAGEPHGDLRARVMARVKAPGDARLKPSRYVLSAFAAAVVLVALVAYRETRPTPSTVRLKPDTTYATAAVPTPELPAAVEQAARPAVNTPAKPRTAAARRAVIPPSAIDALTPPPLDVAPIVVDDLDADPLHLQPLDLHPLDTIAPIAVAPLGPEGDRR